MRKIKHWLMAFALAAGVISSPAVAAYAYTGSIGQEETAADGSIETIIPEQTADAEQTEADTQEETQETGENTSFSIPGNGEVLDDKTEDGTKEFLTVQTKNGNTFFLVLDRSSNTENVYMLSMIDENDLAEFVDGTQLGETPQVMIPEVEATGGQSEQEGGLESDSEQKKENDGTNMGTFLAIVILAAGGIGAGYYFKVVKPKKEEDQEADEDLEFYDGGAYINEDQTTEEDEEDTEDEA